MSAEQEHHDRQNPQNLPLKGIYINFEERAIEFEDAHGTVGRIVFTGEQVLVEGQPLTLAAPPETAEMSRGSWPAVPDTEEPGGIPERREKEPMVVLSGKLMSQPRHGNPDSHGKPTAWARFAAHEEGREDAHLYSATFHRHTAALALDLAKGTPLTIEGYPHQAEPGGKRMDTFSVINLVNYPGKPEKKSSRPRR